MEFLRRHPIHIHHRASPNHSAAGPSTACHLTCIACVSLSLAHERHARHFIFIACADSAVLVVQMVLELCAAITLSYSIGEPVPIALEQRVSDEALLTTTAQLTSMVGAEIAGLAVNRAASSAAMDKLEAFYVDGMGTKMSYSATTSEYTKKCFLWTGATLDVCYTTRADSATKGNWKVCPLQYHYIALCGTMALCR